MNRPLVKAQRRAAVCLLELVAVLGATAAAYEVAVVLVCQESVTFTQISWCDDGIAWWDSPQIEATVLASSGAPVLPFASGSLPSRLVGLGCALLGVASSLYGRICRLAER